MKTVDRDGCYWALRAIWVGLTFGIFSSCSQLLYYPMRPHVTKPDDWGFRYESLKLHHPGEHELSGWRVWVEGVSPRGRVLFFHGNAENISTHFATLAWVARHGLELIILDYSGYGESGGMPSPKQTLRDGLLWIEWMESEFKKNSLPWVVVGQSLGGAVLARTLGVYAETYPSAEIPLGLRHVLFDSTFASYQRVARGVLAQTWLTAPFQALAFLVLRDQEAPVSNRRFPRIPTLLFHGLSDRVVPPRNGRELLQILPEGNRKCIEIPEGVHIDSFWRHSARYRYEYLMDLKLRGGLDLESPDLQKMQEELKKELRKGEE